MGYIIPLVLIGAVTYWFFLRKGASGGCCGGGTSKEPEKTDHTKDCH
ncbi:MAG: hypothetical protein ABID54_00960 [Pseudomonadota bacterium]